MKTHYLFLALLLSSQLSASGTEDVHELMSFLDCKNETLCNSSDATGNCSDVNKEVVEHYTELLDILNQVDIFQISDPDVPLAQLLYESHFHFAVALQNLNLHKKAIEQLTNAAKIASVPKKGCNVGCKYATFFHTPIFSRMAYSHAVCGQMKEAIKDANKAISLDNLNPDVYCVRALAWNSCKETRRAIYDLNYGLRLNPSHICTLILRGAITKSITDTNEQLDKNEDHEKVCKICLTNKRFLDVTDFNSPKIADFYDKEIHRTLKHLKNPEHWRILYNEIGGTDW